MYSAVDSLKERLAGCVPVANNLEYFHLSTPPTRCAALFNPPPGRKAEKTFCESQSLLVAVDAGQADKSTVAIFAIEIKIYTTLQLTTIFISKADSTGYAALLRLPKSSTSILQNLTGQFVSWIIKNRQASGKRLVLSLFARAQSQYLFPGSLENREKHVLDDRQLVKWWCKTLDPVLREYPAPTRASEVVDSHGQTTSARAYLVVPGHDNYETAAFFPQSAKNEPIETRRWVAGHPLWEIAPEPAAPTRCLVPHFPDDPKSRFLDELDEEIADIPSSQKSKHESPSKRGRGQWRSVRTLDQFWDAMAFRQECSSGRLVGFLWIVFAPGETSLRQTSLTDEPASPTRISAKRKAEADIDTPIIEKKVKVSVNRKTLTGVIRPRAPRAKRAEASLDNPNSMPSEITPYYHIPRASRGQLLLQSKSYDRAHELLLRLDFTGVDVAAESTKKWVDETAVIAGRRGYDWGIKVRGSKKVSDVAAPAIGPAGAPRNTFSRGAAINVLAPKKKPKPQDIVEAEPALDTFGSGLREPSSQQNAGPESQKINSLGAGLVRKKPKAV